MAVVIVIIIIIIIIITIIKYCYYLDFSNLGFKGLHCLANNYWSKPQSS